MALNLKALHFETHKTRRIFCFAALLSLTPRPQSSCYLVLSVFAAKNRPLFVMSSNAFSGHSANPRTKTAVHERLSKALLLVAQIWAHFLFLAPCRLVTRVIPIDEVDEIVLLGHRLYQHLDSTSGFKIWEEKHLGYARFAPGLGIDKRLRKAIRNYRQCQSACYAFWDFVRKLLKDDPDVIEIEWKCVVVKPLLALFEKEIGSQGVWLHDIILITCGSGEKFVLDLTGSQFGLPGFFFTYDEYSEYLEERYAEESRDPEEEKARFKNRALNAKDLESFWLWLLRLHLGHFTVEQHKERLIDTDECEFARDDDKRAVDPHHPQPRPARDDNRSEDRSEDELPKLWDAELDGPMGRTERAYDFVRYLRGVVDGREAVAAKPH
ncbi:hypothetical protein BU26DRAFT_570506 [Trematosphaeria pertusa]|uniref:Uncharacterized protein n=1 Tax=Trematosphaeria pertusa TaxID=390896 RepID=A0A6A6HY12_9PLEO|nr:uncharacterized protein BU26DRAFT_570506 [Trematosphaeria pertusa]KAF2243104.1 hypothetical protein BU26DRAFT_570506 [Trematosphaeria pertusa]